jgi:hypothetical protein
MNWTKTDTMAVLMEGGARPASLRGILPMTFEEKLERFWKDFSKADRQFTEAQSDYQAAVEAHDITRATELGCEFCCGGQKARRKAVEKRLAAQMLNGLQPRAKSVY